MHQTGMDTEDVTLGSWGKQMLGRLTLPSRCLACHAWPTDRLCVDCTKLFLRPRARCVRCALSLLPDWAGSVCLSCQRTPPLWHSALAAVPYAYPWNKCLAQLKFHQQPGWVAPLADLLRHTPGWRALMGTADVVVAVPSSPSRLRERGFNHAALLARCLAPRQLLTHALRKIRDTPEQHGLRLEQRLGNLRGAFLVPPSQVGRVHGRRVLLVDDVMTSGGTATACATALLAAGAADVAVAVVARSEPDDERFDTSAHLST